MLNAVLNDLVTMRRVAVIGNAGAGKTTLAKRLAQPLDLEVTHLDLMIWRPGWQRTPHEEFLEAHAHILKRPTWLIEGLGSWDSIPTRLEAADTIIYPDYALPRLYWWAAKRQVASIFSPRPDFPPDCPQLPKTGLLVRVIAHVHREVRPRLLVLLEEHATTKRVIRLRSPQETSRFLHQLEQAAQNRR